MCGVQAERRAKELEEQGPDEDGWTVVSRSKGAPRTEANQIRSSAKAEKRKKQMASMIRISSIALYTCFVIQLRARFSVSCL